MAHSKALKKALRLKDIMTLKYPRLTSQAILSPMVDINDVAFRMLCKKYGAGITYTQMVSATAAARQDKAALRPVDVVPEEKPYGIQIFGQDTSEMVKAVKFIEKTYEPTVIDLNMGCPSSKILQQGAGAALLIKTEKVGEIVKACSSAINTPFTVKIRLGPDEHKIVALEVAKMCEQNGAAALAVHGRTIKQGYSGKADWSIIKQVKESISIPVIGNGDVSTPMDCQRMLSQTGCDFVMIARAAMKSPIIFQQINDYFKTKEYDKTDDPSRLKMINKYLDLADQYKVDFTRVKIHMQHFTTGMSGGAAMRNKINFAKNVGDVRKILNLA